MGRFTVRQRILVLLLIAGPAPLVGQARSRTVDSLAVRAVAAGIVAADNARDLTAVLALYADSAILLPPNAAPVVGHAAIRPRYEALFRAFEPAIDGRIDEVVVAGDWAYVRGHNGGWLRGRAGTPDRALDDVYLMILERQAGSWRITRLMWHRASRLPEPDPGELNRRSGAVVMDCSRRHLDRRW